MKKLLSLLLLAALLLIPVPQVQADVLTVYTEHVLHDISPTLYGLFIEDINCAVDGGLYAELIKNRSFENENLWNPQHADHWEAWTVKQREKAGVTLENDAAISAKNPTFLRFSLEQGGSAAVCNQGFGGNLLRGGIPVQAGAAYDFSLYIRFDEAAAQSGSVVSAQLCGAAGNPLSGEAAFRRESDAADPANGPAGGAHGWRKYTAVLTASETGGAVLRLQAGGEGRIDVDMVSLMPAERVGRDWPGGGMRKDLVEALRALHPSFLRFPGGCVVEGTYVRSNAYNWKDSVSAGDPAERREIPNTWGGMQTMGVGFYEYFCLCEEIGALPVPVVHAGLLCQVRDSKDPPLTMEETKAYAQDILDLIEFATGSADTAWGAMRAQMGHPAPFDLRCIAIGNENWGNAYFARYEVLSAAVKEAYPDITCIVAAGPVAEGALIQDSWNNIRRRFAGDLVDEHYYMDSAWFLSHADRYDRYPRTTKVFLGEYAAHEPMQGSRRPNNLYAALCEAAYLTGVERNSDVVVMSCYAPLLCREGEVDWSPDLIWFNDSTVYKTPSYYVQQLFAASLGDQLLQSALTDPNGAAVEGAAAGLYHVASKTENGQVYVKLVNVSGQAKKLELQLQGAGHEKGTMTVLAGQKQAVNSAVREKIASEEIPLTLVDGWAEITLPGYCAVVIALQ